jgi:hypothetical protein
VPGLGAAACSGGDSCFAVQCLQQRGEAGIADLVAGLPQAGGEGVAGERLAVPAQLVPCCASCGQERGDAGSDAGDSSRLGSGLG